MELIAGEDLKPFSYPESLLEEELNEERTEGETHFRRLLKLVHNAKNQH